ncbi:luciferase family oxidoreductase, group 1 domain protein [Bordetella pertussis H934]|nr:luciferase family oxidoreductase, group 1 domain protein [Bordetella pertussis H934]
MASVPFSVLDLAPIVQGGTAAQAFRNTVDLARHVEGWGYRRFWLAEHHNITGVASSATAVLIGHVAAHTTTLRVGSGGVMLPNHAPLIIAEQFGTLESLFPGRIDLGLGRAPGSDGATQQALRRGPRSGLDFPELLHELRSSRRRGRASRCARFPAPAPTCPSGCWARAISAHGWPPSWACPSRSRGTSRPKAWPPCACTGNCSSRRRRWRAPMP